MFRVVMLSVVMDCAFMLSVMDCAVTLSLVMDCAVMLSIVTSRYSFFVTFERDQ